MLYLAGLTSDVRLPRLALSRTALLGDERAGAEAEAEAEAEAAEEEETKMEAEEAEDRAAAGLGAQLTRVHVLCSPTCSGEKPVLSSRAACSTVDTSGALPDAGLYLLRRSAALPAPAAAPRAQDILPLQVLV